MDVFYLVVTPRRKSFVAKSRYPDVTALGSTPQAAAQNGLLMARELFTKSGCPPTLIVCFDKPGDTTIVTQPIDLPIADGAAGKRLPRHSL